VSDLLFLLFPIQYFLIRCGLTAIANLKKQSFECRACKNKTACSQLYIPYAAKLLFQVNSVLCISEQLCLSSDLGIAKHEYCAAIVHRVIWSNTGLELRLEMYLTDCITIVIYTLNIPGDWKRGLAHQCLTLDICTLVIFT
jgi:hypothetical protein